MKVSKPSATNRRLDGGTGPGRLDRHQRHGNVCVRQRPPMRSGLRVFRNAASITSPGRVHVDMSENSRRGEHAPVTTAQRLARRRLVAVDRHEHREHRRPVDLVDPSDAPRIAAGSAAAFLASGRATGPSLDLGGHVLERQHGRRAPGRVAGPLRRQTTFRAPAPEPLTA